MPNVYNERVWIIDTASGDPITTEMVDIDVIRWVHPTDSALGFQAVITDAEGNTVWEAANADETERLNIESYARIVCKGLRVPTLGVGKLYLYHTIVRT